MSNSKPENHWHDLGPDILFTYVCRQAKAAGFWRLPKCLGRFSRAQLRQLSRLVPRAIIDALVGPIRRA